MGTCPICLICLVLSDLSNVLSLALFFWQRLPPCPERTEVEAKMDSAKGLVAAGGLGFAKYAEELTHSIQREYFT